MTLYDMAFVWSAKPVSLRPSCGSLRGRCCNVRASAVHSDAHGASRRTFIAAALAASVGIALSPEPVHADHTLVSAKLSFDRYFPRIRAGLGQLKEVREALMAGDSAKAKAIVNDKTFAVKLRRALEIYATSFSDSNINQQSRDLRTCVDGFYKNISKSVEASSKEEAVLRFNDAVQALQAYIRVARLTSRASASELLI